MGCTLLWFIKLQTEITLSKIEAEYISLIQAMGEVITFMEFMKEVYFIFDIYLLNPKLFSKVSKYKQRCISITESKNSHKKQNILLLSIIIYGALHKIILFEYTILIHENKQWTFSLRHSEKYYSSIYKENYLDGDFKSKTFASKQGSTRIQRTTQAHNSHN